jgi:multiple sugar transport system permease protein
MAQVRSTGVAQPQGTVERKPRKPPGLFGRIRRQWADYTYIFPALFAMFIVIGYPIAYTVYLSFYTTPTAGDNVMNGLTNYTSIITSSRFWMITQNTMYWTVVSTILAFIIGTAAALVAQREFIGRGLVRGIFLIPWVISHVATAYIWVWIFHSDYGLVSGVLMDLGIIDSPLIILDSTTWAMPALILVNVWKDFPFIMIMMLAGLQTVPEQLMRAAKIDGAGTWHQFRHVMLPHLKGVIIITLLLTIVMNLNHFTLPWIMTGGGPASSTHIWITEVYALAFRSLRFGIASAFAVVLFIIMMSMGYFYVKALTAGDERSR